MLKLHCSCFQRKSVHRIYSNINEIIPLTLFKEKAKEYLVKVLEQEVYRNSKLVVYRKIKTKFETEGYLKIILIRD